MTQVSIVVIAYNEERSIAACLAAIQSMQGLPKDHEIVVIDDGSTDRTGEIVSRLALSDARIRYVRQENLGRGAARARGITEISMTPVVGFIDADVQVPEDWWICCSQALDSFDAVGGVAVPDGDVNYVHHLLRLTPKPVAHTTTVSGTNGLFRRSVFEVVGFESGLRNGEDVALNHAMTAAGLRSTSLPDLHVAHEEHKDFLSSCAWLFEQGIGASRQFARYRQWRLPDLVVVASLALSLASLLAVAYTPWSLLVAPIFIVLVTLIHLHQKFALTRSPLRSLAAVGVHGVLMTCYLAGRVRGLPEIWR